MERVIFAMVANRCLEPLSKLAGTRWVRERTHIDGLDDVDEDMCYRAMDWLLEIEDDLAEAVYWATADLLNLEVDLLFFDTTSTYFETETADPPPATDKNKNDNDKNNDNGKSDNGDDGEGVGVGFRSRGHSKDHRRDLPQVVVGMAVTRTGIPIRVWCWPGNTNDMALIRQVKDDLHAWKLSRVVWVADRGFTSAENRRYLQRCGGHYILGEKLRSTNKEAAAALGRQGRYHTVAGNLQVKEVVVDDGTMRDRFVVCYNPDEASRDKAVRDEIIAGLETAIADTDTSPETRRSELAADLRTKPAYRRFLRTTKGGLLRIDRSAVRAEAHLDGKFLLRSSDPTLSAEDIALGYKQLLEVERGWRDMKTTLRLRPVYHRKQDRIRAHVLLCWLGLLLIRLAETTTGDTWRNLRHELDRLHVGTFAGPTGTSQHRTEITPGQRNIFKALDLADPPRFTHLQTKPEQR